MLTSAFRLSGDARYFQGQLSAGMCLRRSAPTPFNVLFRQHAGVSLLRLSFTAEPSNGILTVSSIEYASRLSLRSRLNLIRLALIRMPWFCGEGVSRSLYRYLCLHLLFHPLQPTSRSTFSAVMECSPTNLSLDRFHVFGTVLMPDYYPCRTTRLVSCYALFK